MMDQQLTGHGPGEAAVPEDTLAEQLIREEFGRSTSPADDTVPVPVVTPAEPTTAAVTAGATIHEEFAEPVPPRRERSRSHRAGMLAGLGVVGALLAVLVVLSPGSGQPRLPAQSVHDLSPFVPSGPKTAAATVAPTTAVASTTSSTVAAPSTTQPPHTVTAPTTVTYVYQSDTPTPAPVSTQTTDSGSPSTTPASSPPPPPTTTTTAPSTTTTTTRQCVLGLIC